MHFESEKRCGKLILVRDTVGVGLLNEIILYLINLCKTSKEGLSYSQNWQILPEFNQNFIIKKVVYKFNIRY